MNTRLIAIVILAGVMIFTAACSNDKPVSAGAVTEQNGSRQSEEAKMIEAKAAQHEKAVADARSTLAEIMKPEEQKLQWSTELRGEAEARAICNMEERYGELKSFVDSERFDSSIKLSDVGDEAAIRGELRKRAISYIGSVVKAIKADHFPSCISTGNLEYGPASFVENLTNDLEALKIGPNDVGTIPAELRGLYLREAKKTIPGLLTDYRSKQVEPVDGRSKRDSAIYRLVSLVQEYNFSATQLGIPPVDYTKFANAKHYGEGDVCLSEECPKDVEAR